MRVVKAERKSGEPVFKTQTLDKVVNLVNHFLYMHALLCGLPSPEKITEHGCYLDHDKGRGNSLAGYITFDNSVVTAVKIMIIEIIPGYIFCPFIVAEEAVVSGIL